MNNYSVRFPNGDIHGAPTLTAALKRAARATREGRSAPSVYKHGRKLATCRLTHKRHRGPDRTSRSAKTWAVFSPVATCTLLKAGKAELRRTKRR